MKPLRAAVLPGLVSLLVLGTADPGLAGTLDEVKLGIARGPTTHFPGCKKVEGLLGFPACDNYCGTENFYTDDGGAFETTAYVVALDVDPDVGLQTVNFGLSYRDAAVDPYVGAYIIGWSTCADEAVFDPGFPSQGGVTLSFSECRDTPSPGDPDGDASVVLLGLLVQDYGATQVCVAPHPAAGSVRLTDCAGRVSTPGSQNLGCYGVGQSGRSPCQAAILHCYCSPNVGPVAETYACCRNGVLSSLSCDLESHQACTQSGGTVLTQPCIPCAPPLVCEPPVSVESVNWGGLKSRYE